MTAPQLKEADLNKLLGGLVIEYPIYIENPESSIGKKVREVFAGGLIRQLVATFLSWHQAALHRAEVEARIDELSGAFEIGGATQDWFETRLAELQAQLTPTKKEKENE